MDYRDLDQISVGDGKADDSAGMHTAWAMVIAAGGGSIYLDPSKKYLTSQLVLNTANITIRFYGGGELIQKDDKQSLVVVRIATGVVVFDGIKVNGNNLTLSNNSWGVITANLGKLTFFDTEISNTKGVGATTNTGGRITMYRSRVHHTGSHCVYAQGVGKADISYNDMWDSGDSMIVLGPNSGGSGPPCINEGFIVSYNNLDRARADLGGEGQHGNGINAFKISNGRIIANHPNDCAFSFIRLNDVNHVVVGENIGHRCGETGMYAEFGCEGVKFLGNELYDCGGAGLDATNVRPGVFVTCNDNIVQGFGLTHTTCFGIGVEQGQMSMNQVDGKGHPNATWGYKFGTGGGISVSFQVMGLGNQVGGCCYDVGVTGSSTGGVKRIVVGQTMNFRKDANFKAHIGAIAGYTSDGGDGSKIGADMLKNIFWDRNYFNVPAAQAPKYGEAGSQMLIDGRMKTTTATAWV